MSQKKKMKKQHRKEVRKERAKQIATTENPAAKKPVTPYTTKGE